MPDFPLTLVATADDAARRLDQYLVTQLAEVSRARIQEMIAAGHVLVNQHAEKASYKLREGDSVEVTGTSERPPLRAMAEDIPLDIFFEDDDLAVVNKPAGMMVHAGAGATDDDRNRGTLVNALLHRFAALSGVGGELRPGIVHRLDRETSGLMIVAKNDIAHRKLADQFSGREVKKTYIALVHGAPKQESGTINSAISRDAVRRTRMTVRRSGGRSAISHWKVKERLDTRWGKFALVEVRIESGRTHQIRVHMSSIGHPVVGDTLYGAPAEMKPTRATEHSARTQARTAAALSRRSVKKTSTPSSQQQALRSGEEDAETQAESPGLTAGIAGPPSGSLTLSRNFLHAARLEFLHPRSRERLSFESALPQELTKLLDTLRHQ
jgi:23S rRNA pseudouridine1911/1915/1917 synthase